MSDINTQELKALETAMKEAVAAMGVSVRKTQETADKALDEVKKLDGVIEAKTNDKLKEVLTEGKKNADEVCKLRGQIVELAQKIAVAPAGGSGDDQKFIYEIVQQSPEWQAASKRKGGTSMEPVLIGNPHRHLALMQMKTQIVNATGQNQPLVPSHRVAGIIPPAERRFYMRDLIPATPTDTNLIEYTTEASFTNNARPQGDASPGGIEGEEFAESAMTFSLSTAAVATVGHWIPASRQVLSDAKMLQGHLNHRLLFGLKLEEETELLTGNGTAGTLNGLNNQAAAYNRGVTNDTMLQTLLKAILQVSLSDYEATGFVLNPVDWVESVLITRDTQNRYIFADPHNMETPRVWGLPVVATRTMTQGRFLCGAFSLAAQIWDREDATVRISENVDDHFIRNMVAILVEERLALTVYRTTALAYGNTSHAG